MHTRKHAHAHTHLMSLEDGVDKLRGLGVDVGPQRHGAFAHIVANAFEFGVAQERAEPTRVQLPEAQV